jgi:glycogen synthase
MKVCMFLTNPVTNDPRVRREAASLAKAGHEVVVIGLKKEVADFSEEWLDGHRLDGYRVIRITHPRFLAHHVRAIQARVLHWFAEKSPSSYRRIRSLYRWVTMQRSEPSTSPAVPSAARERLRTDILTIIGAVYLNIVFAKHGIRLRADVYHAHDLDTLLGAYLAAVLTRGHLVYDFHELYTEQFSSGVKTWIWYAWYRLLERVLAKRADLRLTVCDSLGDWFTQQYRTNSVLTVRNVPVFHEPTSAGRRRRSETERVILYHGLYFKNRGLEQLIEAVPYLKRGHVVLRGYGSLEPELRELVRQRHLEHRVTFAPPVGVTDLVKNATHADIGVGAFVPLALNTKFALPNKLFEYMMAGLAVVATDLPEMRKVILGHQIGRVCKPDDPEDLAKALNELLENDDLLEQMKRNALVASQTVFNWNVEEQVFLKAYESLRAA